MDKYDWSILKSEHVLKDKWISVRADTCKMPNGKIVEPYYVLEYPTWVSVVAITKQNEIILVKQYRHGCQKTALELPAGRMEASDNTPMDAMRRELLEETGYSSDNFIEVCSICANPANHNNLTHCFLALDAEQISKPNLDETEQIEVILKPIDEVIDMIRNNEFLQALHVSALTYALIHLGIIKI